MKYDYIAKCEHNGLTAYILYTYSESDFYSDVIGCMYYYGIEKSDGKTLYGYDFSEFETADHCVKELKQNWDRILAKPLLTDDVDKKIHTCIDEFSMSDLLSAPCHLDKVGWEDFLEREFSDDLWHDKDFWDEWNKFEACLKEYGCERDVWIDGCTNDEYPTMYINSNLVASFNTEEAE